MTKATDAEIDQLVDVMRRHHTFTNQLLRSMDLLLAADRDMLVALQTINAPAHVWAHIRAAAQKRGNAVELMKEGASGVQAAFHDMGKVVETILPREQPTK